MTPEQIAALSLTWKVVLAACGAGAFVGAVCYALYKAVKSAGNPIREAAVAAASETIAQTETLKAIVKTGELTKDEVRELGRRFTVSDERHERQSGEVNRTLARHEAILATHADAIHANGARFKPLEDSLARVQTVLSMRKTDEAMGGKLVEALSQEPPPQSPETPATPAER